MSNPTSPVPTSKSAQALTAFLGEVERLVEAYEAQAGRLLAAHEQLAALEARNSQLQGEIERLREAVEPAASQQLELAMLQDSIQHTSPHSHQSDSPSLTREEVQMLLSEIDSCIAMLAG